MHLMLRALTPMLGVQTQGECLGGPHPHRESLKGDTSNAWLLDT